MRQRWGQILEAVKSESRVAWMTMMEGVSPVSVEGKLLTIAFENDGKRKNFSSGNRDVVLAKVLKGFTGIDFRIDAVLAGNVSTRPSQPQNTQVSAPLAKTSWEPVAKPAAPAPAPRPQQQKPPKQPQARPEPTPPADFDPLPPVPEGPTEAYDESDEAGPVRDAPPVDEAVSGMALIQRELGGQVIKEIDNT